MIQSILMRNPTRTERGFSLAEAIVGIGLAAMLVLAIIGLTTASLRGDQVAETRQLALATANSELNRLNREVSVAGNSARSAFWGAPDGVYNGPGTTATVSSNKIEFQLTYRTRTLLKVDGAILGSEKPRNRVKKVDLVVAWWGGSQGKPGYGQLSVTASKLFRESDVREP